MKPREDWGLFNYRTADGKRWAVRLRVQGRLWQRQGFTTKTDARNFRDKIRGERVEGAFFPDRYRRRRQHADTLLELLARHTPAELESVAGLTDREKRRYWEARRFGRWWTGRLGHLSRETLTADAIAKALARLDSGPATANRYRTWLVSILNLEKIIPNPAAESPRQVEPKAPEVSYSVAQEQALYAELEPPDADIVRLTLITMMRQAELFARREEEIDWTRRVLILPDPKAGEPQYIHLTQEAVRILRRILRRRPQPSPWILPSRKNPAKHRSAGAWYTKVFKPARDRAKIPPTHTFHTIRHTGPGRLAENNVPDVTIQALGRWKTPGLVSRYTHHRRGHLEAALEQAFPAVGMRRSMRRQPRRTVKR